MEQPGPVSGSSMPPCLPGFEGARRYWDRIRNCPAVKLFPGDYYVTREAELLVTVLGSCVSACIRDPVARVGGMNHFLLPDGEPDDCLSAATRYGSHAMERLVNDILRWGGRRERLEVKIVGGGRILAGTTDVGARNVAFVRAYLQREGLSLLGEDVGDVVPRKVVYCPVSGKVRVRRLRSLHNQTLVARERAFMDRVSAEPVAGEVELF